MTTPGSGKLAVWTVNSPPPREEADYAGSLFAGRYRLHRQIGNGGMSTIHEAHDATLGTRVAIKIMRGDLPSDPVDRFRREAHVLAALSHEHIARIIDRQDPEEGPRFLVTEYIDGLDLGVLRRRGPLPAAVVLQIGLQVSAALAHVHAAGVIHRDLKPSNMMLVRHSGGDIFVKVIDFGLAKLERGSELAAPGNAPPGARRATRGDAVHGTVPYWCGEEGPRRDIYALALTLAELLTGEAPDVNANLAREAVPPALARAIKAALSAAGSTTMDHFHSALREVQDAIPVRVSEAVRRDYVGRALTDPSAPEPGEAPRFAERYIVCSELGEGGMGRVQLVFDTEHQRRVALKTIQPRYAGNKNLAARFRREGRALAAIEHIGVPTLLEGGLAPRPYFTMEIVTGVSLAAALKDGRMEPARALSLAIELGKVLCAAHEVGVIHRDVKPDNIILGHGDRVHLLDFGACLLMPRFHQRNVMFPGTPPDERYNTGDYELVGTPGYTAPEVMSQESGAGPRSDVYSVCVVLYEMLTGWPLIDRTTYTERKVVRGNFPASLAQVVELLRGGTSHEPSDRPRSMTDLVGALEVARTNLLHARHALRPGQSDAPLHPRRAARAQIPALQANGSHRHHTRPSPALASGPMMTPTPQTEPLYVFALWMLGSRDAALEQLRAALDEAGPQTGALQALVARLIATERPSRVDHFADLDDKLRTNFTIPVGLNHSLVNGDPRRLNILFWELQRRCLLTVLRGLSPLRRAVFILRHVLGHTPESCAELCTSTLEAVGVAEGRARRELEDYLGARCEHVHRRNACHCTARLGNALECGLVSWPDHGDHDGSAFIPKPHSDVAALYASLPRVRLPVLASGA